MLFNSFAYGVFLPIVFALYWILPHRHRWWLLFLSSYYFYMSWNVSYVVLILFTTVISYCGGLVMERVQSERARKTMLWVVLIACLGVLFVFKYFNFVTNSIARFCQMVSIPMHPFTLKLMLPVGISFYTFQTLSYVIDVYKGDVKAEHHFGIYATFVSFFPQLVAGPIERSGNLLHQIRERHTFDYQLATDGMKLLTWGFFKKLVVADNLAVYVDRIYNGLPMYQGLSLVMATVFFAFQIYCDFSGYSDIARGTANLFGIRLMTNFKSPYFSASMKEFWGRWHISLSTWFRDYVYIPLGGNRVKKSRHYMNLLVTFLVSGLWHGANWTFVIWGGIHGILQVAEEALGLGPKKNKNIQDTKQAKSQAEEPDFADNINNRKQQKVQVTLQTEERGLIRGATGKEKPVRDFGWWLRVTGVFVVVCIAWVFFRANGVRDAFYLLTHMFCGVEHPYCYLIQACEDMDIWLGQAVWLGVYLVVLMVYDYISLDRDVIAFVNEKKPALRWLLYFALVTFIIFNRSVTESTFIYFQF